MTVPAWRISTLPSCSDANTAANIRSCNDNQVNFTVLYGSIGTADHSEQSPGKGQRSQAKPALTSNAVSNTCSDSWHDSAHVILDVSAWSLADQQQSIKRLFLRFQGFFAHRLVSGVAGNRLRFKLHACCRQENNTLTGERRCGCEGVVAIDHMLVFG